MSDDRHTCTADDPWTPDKSWGAYHPDAKVVAEYDGWPAGDVEKCRCPHCGHTWKEELPQ